jgi:hypothetical protein
MEGKATNSKCRNTVPYNSIPLSKLVGGDSGKCTHGHPHGTDMFEEHHFLEARNAMPGLTLAIDELK